MMKLSDLSVHAFIQEHKLKNEQGIPIEFRDHLFLFDIYSDESDKLVVTKAAQVGMTTAEVIRLFFLSRKKKLDIIFTLPNDNDVNTFVSGKVNRIIAQNPVLQDMCQDKDSIFQKAVGESIVYFRSTFSKKKATMITAGMLVHDEINASDLSVIEQYQSRLLHSETKITHVFSHPSIPSYGVDVYWQKSDQKHWFILCPNEACKKEQFMDFPASVCFERRCYQCKFCGEQILTQDRRAGRWVKRFNDREWSGYWIPLLICPWVSAGEIIDKWNDPDTSKEYFWNILMGKSYESKETGITREDIFRNCSPVLNSQQNVVIGCDSGLIKHYVIGNEEGIFYYNKTEDWKDIAALLKLYPRSVLVVDALPDLTGPQQLQEQFPGRVIVSYYHEDRKSMQLVRFGEDKEKGVVHIDRNRILTRIMDEFRERRIPLQGAPKDWEEYASHFLNLYRVKEENKLGEPVFRWEKKSTMDHYAHATVYWRAGMTKFGGKGKIVKPTFLDEISSLKVSPTISPQDTAVIKQKDYFILPKEGPLFDD